MSSYPSANNPGSRPENLTGTSSNTNNPYADPPPYQPQAGYQPAYTPAYPSYPPQSNSGVYPPSSSSGFNAAPLPPPPAGYPGMHCALPMPLWILKALPLDHARCAPLNRL